jgi:hypothetical protein
MPLLLPEPYRFHIYVENEYYGGLECKIEKGKIVDSKDWRRRKFRKKDDLK